MKYTDWIDQLKQNLLNVPDAERRRVMDYYAEAYADRRAAGFSENEIIEGFGAPYDAAQAILDDVNITVESEEAPIRSDKNESFTAPPPEPQTDKKSGNGWVPVILGLILAIPVFVILVTLVSLTVSFAVSPIAVVASGGAYVVYGFIIVASSEVGLGISYLGVGFIAMGVGIILAAIFFALIKLMWKVWGVFFKWLKSLFNGGAK